MSKTIRVFYLNWDQNCHEFLIRGLITGEAFDFNKKNYRHISDLSMNVDDVSYSTIETLNIIYHDFNQGKQGNNRSMSVGDLIAIDNKRYIVKPLGFELAE